jgi:3-oxoacyl-[acyl-carrier-protein] synthase-3
LHGVLAGIEYYLPEQALTTDDLARQFPHWRVAQTDKRTQIQCRHLASADECASDLAAAAARKLFDAGACRPQDIDFVLLCTQSPDYALPPTACLLQHRLGIPSGAGALDFNLGCSGFVYGLGLGEGLIATGQAQTVLLLTAETYSKYIGDDDKSALMIFGDAAAATLISSWRGESAIGPFVYGTDGSGGEHVIVPESAARRSPPTSPADATISPTIRPGGRLSMNGLRVFDFTMTEVPRAVAALLHKAALRLDDVDLFVFHQANGHTLEELRRRIDIPADKFHIAISHCGNTVSSSIPIALKDAERTGHLRRGARVMLVGYGVGFSWAATLVKWHGAGDGAPAG